MVSGGLELAHQSLQLAPAQVVNLERDMYPFGELVTDSGLRVEGVGIVLLQGKLRGQSLERHQGIIPGRRGG